MPRTVKYPRTNVGGVIGCAKDEFRGSIIPGTNVADVGLASHQDLCRAKIAELQNPGSRVEEKILGFDISVTDANRMNVSQGPHELIHIQLDL